MIPNITYKAHYSTPPQAKLFLNYLLNTHPTASTVSIVVEMEAKLWKKKNGSCNSRVFTKGVYTSLVVSVGTKKKPRSTPHILRTLAHEYCHVLQNDVAIKFGPELCVEANAFAEKVVPDFLADNGLILAAKEVI